MSFRFDSFQGTERTFALRDGQPAITLDAEGIRHPSRQRRIAQTLTPYAELTHLATSARVLWIGARDSVYVVPRGNFLHYDTPERLVAAVLERIAERPGGDAQIARMTAIEERSRRGSPPRATWALIATCIVIFFLQTTMGFPVDLAGHYSPVLVADGDIWRLITANLLHARPGPIGLIHIGLNMIALLALGTLLERPLGVARTACVMAVAAVGSMATSGWFGNTPVVGASGIVFGLAGGVLWLDYRRAEELPAWWRFPRRSLLTLVVLNLALGIAIPFIALAAHMGGFVAGGLATAGVMGRVCSRPPAWVRVACASVVGVTILSVGTVGMEVFSGGDVSARYAARYARLPDISPAELNDHAWLIAISMDPSRAELEAALMLAERAVAETQRSEATILDTLAEVQFALGLTDAAIATIEEAIAHEPADGYFREQRKRFTGERDSDDRPEYVPPWFPDSPDVPPAPKAAPSEPGLTV